MKKRKFYVFVPVTSAKERGLRCMNPYHWNRMYFIQRIVICPLQGK